MDVHIFDGRLNDILIPYRPKLEEIKKMDVNVKKQFINGFIDKFSNTARRTIHLIYAGGNDELTNSLNALDVLYLILTVEADVSYMKNVDEQLSDIVNPGGGTCPSGRTTRLMQLYVQFTESKNFTVLESEGDLKK